MGRRKDKSTPTLLSADLHRFILQAGDVTCSVIAEVDVPEVTVDLKPNRDAIGGRLVPVRVGPLSKEDEGEVLKRMARVAEYLSKTLTSTPVVLWVARAFVFDVTPRKLSEVAESQLFRTIRANRRN